jgi:Leucine-rich repeat (LRR) protein
LWSKIIERGDFRRRWHAYNRASMRALLIAVVLSVSSLPAQAAIPQGQRDALIALYDSTNGDAWTSHIGWRGAAGTECSWQGVICDVAKSTVVTLALPSNNLTGSLPSQIGSLPDLDQINLLYNQVSGPIPAELGQLSKLATLNFASNKLSGAIPATWGTSPRCSSSH